MLPRSNIRFWWKKIRNNIRRDRIISNNIINNGKYKIVRIWECMVNEFDTKSFGANGGSEVNYVSFTFLVFKRILANFSKHLYKKLKRHIINI